MSGDKIKNILEDFTLDDILHFKYAPVTSIDVKSTFSVYENLLSDQRRYFMFENVKQ